MNEPTEIIDATDMPQEERDELAERLMQSMAQEARARHESILDDLPEEEWSFTTEWHGDSLSEAMGRAYKTRDTITKHTNRTTTVTHTGTAWQLDGTMMYEFEIHIEGAE